MSAYCAKFAAAQSPSCHTISVSHCSLEHEIKRFWEIEELPAPKRLSPEKQQCEERFLTSHSRVPDGRYIVRLPFRTGPPIDIVESRPIALKRLTELDSRLKTNAELQQKYSEFLREYENLNRLES